MIALADEVALAFAYEPNEKIDAALAQMRQRVIDQLLVFFPNVPPETIAAGVDTIIGSIHDRKCEIERVEQVRSKN